MYALYKIYIISFILKITDIFIFCIISEMEFDARAAAVIDAENVQKINSQAPYLPHCAPADIDMSLFVYPFENGIDVRSLSQSSLPLELECLQGGKIIIPLLDENSSVHNTGSISMNHIAQDGGSFVEVSRTENRTVTHVETYENNDGLGGQALSKEDEEKNVDKELDISEKIEAAVPLKDKDSTNEFLIDNISLAEIENQIVQNVDTPVLSEPESIEQKKAEAENYKEQWLAILYEATQEMAVFPEEFDLPEEPNISVIANTETLAAAEYPKEVIKWEISEEVPEKTSLALISSKDIQTEISSQNYLNKAAEVLDFSKIDTSIEEISSVDLSEITAELEVSCETVTSEVEEINTPMEIPPEIATSKIVTSLEEEIKSSMEEIAVEESLLSETVTSKEEEIRSSMEVPPEIAVEEFLSSESVTLKEEEIRSSTEISPEADAEKLLSSEIASSKKEIKTDLYMVDTALVETPKEHSLADSAVLKETSTEKSVAVSIETPKKVITETKLPKEEYILIPVRLFASKEEGVVAPIKVETSEDVTPVEVDIPIAREIRVTVATKDYIQQSTKKPEVQSDASVKVLAILPKRLALWHFLIFRVLWYLEILSFPLPLYPHPFWY